MTNLTDCQHTQIRTWFYDDTREPAGFWSCVSCGTKFEPVNVERDADAERYRYLRNRIAEIVLSGSGPAIGCWIDCENAAEELILLTGDDADAAIDAARRGEA